MHICGYIVTMQQLQQKFCHSKNISLRLKNDLGSLYFYNPNSALQTNKKSSTSFSKTIFFLPGLKVLLWYRVNAILTQEITVYFLYLLALHL